MTSGKNFKNNVKRRRLLRRATFLTLLVLLAIVLTLFWFARPYDVDFDEARSKIPHAEYSHFANLGQVRIHYQEKGTGVPLLLIHGFSSSTFSWKDIFEQLSNSFRVIAVDLKGHGFSGKPDGDYTRRAQAALIVQLLDYLSIDKAWLVGNSMGGEIALNVAVLNGHRVAGLILIDSGGVNVEGEQSLAPSYMRIPVIGRLLIALALTSDRLVRRGLEKSFFDDSKVTEERVAAYHRPLKTRGGQLAAVRARMQANQFPIEQQLNTLTVPTLIIWGAEDVVVPPAAGRKMNGLIAASKLIIIENCGHTPQEERPERVLEEIHKFVSPLQSFYE